VVGTIDVDNFDCFDFIREFLSVKNFGIPFPVDESIGEQKRRRS
jgi:hypothetical protein